MQSLCTGARHRDAERLGQDRQRRQGPLLALPACVHRLADRYADRPLAPPLQTTVAPALEVLEAVERPRRWIDARAESKRPINVQELHEHLAEEHRYAGSYRSVLRYVRTYYPRPKMRTYRRVETPPGARSSCQAAITSARGSTLNALNLRPSSAPSAARRRW